jgi:threonine dehydrogenase-like Zn-dependent dehydrogenase
MPSVAFVASEYQVDGSIRPVPYVFEGATADGWEIHRDGAEHLRLGPGYRLLRVSHCGVCATDLARRHLPFPLPQVLGHEVVASDEHGIPVVVEINASHAARGVDGSCAYCARGLASHCPDRLVLGIHDLPGGFAPWLLAPVGAVVPLPSTVSVQAASFVEPFAAALHAVRVVTRVPRRRIAVLGPRRLGMLVVAALAAWRARTGAAWEIVALARRARLRDLARRLGADDAREPGALDAADVVVDTTGSPEGFAAAIALARDEVHVKTTCGLPAGGLAHATAMVVDELALGREDTPLVAPAGGPPYETALVLDGAPPSVRTVLAGRGLRLLDPGALASTPFGAADVVVAGSLAEVDAAIRPCPDVERGLVRPRGLVLLAATHGSAEPLAVAVRERGLVVTTSRCGDFHSALDLLPDAPDLAGHLVTATFAAARLGDAFATAARPEHLKVVVTQPGDLF